MNLKYFFYLSCLFLSLKGLALEDENSTFGQTDTVNWQLSLGAFAADFTMPRLAGDDSQFRGVLVRGDITIEYKNFYLDAKSGDFYGGSDIGYQWIVEPNWGLDVIYGNYQMSFSQNGYFNDAPVPELLGIKERRNDHSFGLSYYRTYGNFQTSVEVVYDVFGPTDGWVFHVEATRNFELRNWDLWLNFGANFYSANFHNYYYGVRDYEATSFRPAHETGASGNAFLQFELNRPISQSWVFSSGASFMVGDSGIKKSPLVETNFARVIFMGVKYVF
ncbi:hypothetical protein PALB_34770 [Pseudoalteromonas luteoviolacea B = ATCC 29581]|nr:hypothetical protein PALB_34770 [Pseudoalteromonas luteoviolacea B = ATCC 29581]